MVLLQQSELQCSSGVCFLCASDDEIDWMSLCLRNFSSSTGEIFLYTRNSIRGSTTLIGRYLVVGWLVVHLGQVFPDNRGVSPAGNLENVMFSDLRPRGIFKRRLIAFFAAASTTDPKFS